jgi:hypothetical protein
LQYSNTRESHASGEGLASGAQPLLPPARQHAWLWLGLRSGFGFLLWWRFCWCPCYSQGPKWYRTCHRSPAAAATCKASSAHARAMRLLLPTLGVRFPRAYSPGVKSSPVVPSPCCHLHGNMHGSGLGLSLGFGFLLRWIFNLQQCRCLCDHCLGPNKLGRPPCLLASTPSQFRLVAHR